MPEGSESAALRRLVQGLAHELRAPLQSLLGHLDLLREGRYGPLTPEQGEALASVAAHAERILAVTRDVLQVARIEAGRDHVIVGEVELDALLRREVDAVAPLALSAGLELRLRCPPGLRAVTDGAKVARIVTNLLSNAVKFTPRGRVTVRAGVLGDGVFVEVADTGVGIPEERQEEVFAEYVRLDPGREGTGLGLSIARRLARLCGGDLTLASRPGEGTTVRLELPGRGKLGAAGTAP